MDLIEVSVSVFPDCYFCSALLSSVAAAYDAETVHQGRWAFMCGPCWVRHGRGQLGEGHGQQLVLSREG